MDSARLGRVHALSDLFPSEEAASPGAVDPISHEPVVFSQISHKERRHEPSRPLDAWERYRALNDAMNEAYELMDHGNREARFAVLVIGILSAFVVIGASKPEVAGAFDHAVRIGAASLLGVYALTAVYFLFQAIAALRPGKYRPDLASWNPDTPDFPRGVRYYEDVVQRDEKSHWQAWGEVSLAQLNAELAVQHHSLCLKANVRRNAQARLFAGLHVMVVLAVCLMALFVYAVWI